MRNLLIITFVLSAFMCVGQSSGGTTFSVDTLDDAETITFTYGGTIKNSLADVFLHVACDSIAGTPAGTIKYQSSNDGVEWHTESTDTITDAAETDQSYKLTSFAGTKVRIVIVGTGTQEVECSPSIHWKRAN